MRHYLNVQYLGMVLFMLAGGLAAGGAAFCLAAVLKWNNILPSAGIAAGGFIAAWVFYESSYFFVPGDE